MASKIPIKVLEEISYRSMGGVFNIDTKQFEAKGYKSPEEALKTEFQGQGGWTLREKVDGWWLANFHNGKVEVVNDANESVKVPYNDLLSVCARVWPVKEGKQLQLF